MQKEDNNAKQETVFGRFVRLACVIPTATAVTAGLFVTMNHLVDPGDLKLSEVEYRSLESITPKEVTEDELRKPRDAVEKLETPVPPPVRQTTTVTLPDAVFAVAELPEPDLFVKATAVEPSPIQPNFERQRAEPIRAPRPDFPQIAAIRGISGACDVRFDINPRGEPYNISAECTDRVFEREAVRATRQALFAAPVRNGTPIGQKNLVYPIVFQLNE